MTKEKLLSIINKHLGYAEQEIYDAVAEYEKEKISFAKRHCEAALKAASENSYVEYIDLDTKEIFDYTDVITDDNVGADVNKKSILNAYPLKNIK
jgi:hypothetical protein